MDFRIYLKLNGENVDLASRITSSGSNLRLEASIYQNLRFCSKTLRKIEKMAWGKRVFEEMSWKELILGLKHSLSRHIINLSKHAHEESQTELSIRVWSVRTHVRFGTHWLLHLLAHSDTAADIVFLPSPSRHTSWSVQTRFTENILWAFSKCFSLILS
jgi:hypothetical protein